MHRSDFYDIQTGLALQNEETRETKTNKSQNDFIVQKHRLMSVKFANNLCLLGQEKKLDKAFLISYVPFSCFTDNMCSPDCTLKLDQMKGLLKIFQLPCPAQIHLETKEKFLKAAVLVKANFRDAFRKSEKQHICCTK